MNIVPVYKTAHQNALENSSEYKIDWPLPYQNQKNLWEWDDLVNNRSRVDICLGVQCTCAIGAGVQKSYNWVDTDDWRAVKCQLIWQTAIKYTSTDLFKNLTCIHVHVLTSTCITLIESSFINIFKKMTVRTSWYIINMNFCYVIILYMTFLSTSFISIYCNVNRLGPVWDIMIDTVLCL